MHSSHGGRVHPFCKEKQRLVRLNPEGPQDVHGGGSSGLGTGSLM